MGWAGARWEVLVEGSVLTYPLLRPQFNLSNPKYSSDPSMARKDARSLSVRGRWLLKLKDGRPSPIAQLRFYTLFGRLDILFYLPVPTSPNREPHLRVWLPSFYPDLSSAFLSLVSCRCLSVASLLADHLLLSAQLQITLTYSPMAGVSRGRCAQSPSKGHCFC